MAYTQMPGRDKAENENINALTNGGTDPKKKKKSKVTSETSVNKNATVDGVTGTLKTLKTTTNTEGTTGKSFSSLPKNIQAEAREYRKNNPSTPSKKDVNIRTRFTPNAGKLDSSGPSFSPPKLEANLSNVQPLKEKSVTIAVSKGPGVNASARRNASRSGSMGGASSYTQDKQTVSSAKASKIRTAVNVANQELGDKYSAENITANLNRRGVTNPAAIKRAINKGKKRISANATKIDYDKRN
jgi:hypothetical protein